MKLKNFVHFLIMRIFALIMIALSVIIILFIQTGVEIFLIAISLAFVCYVIYRIFKWLFHAACKIGDEIGGFF